MSWSRNATLVISPELEIQQVPIGDLEPNPWNPNRQDAFIFEKEKASIREFGFVVPVTCRELRGKRFQIIDGEHRWKAAKELGYKTIPVISLGIVPDDSAKQLTIILNETKGVAQPELIKTLLSDLLSRKPKEDLLKVLPFTPMQFDGLVGTFNWDKAEKPIPVQERWVMRSYRMPAEAAEVLDEAIGKVQEDDPCPDWQALERLAADFLGGT